MAIRVDHRKYGDPSLVPDTAHDVEDEDGDVETKRPEDQWPIADSPLRLNGKPFSAVHHSIRVQYFDEPPELFDEFGFRKPTDGVSVEEPEPIEDPKQRMKWISHIESRHTNTSSLLHWGDVRIEAINDERATDMIKDYGIPHSMRAFMWPRLCGATVRRQSSTYKYAQICKEANEELLEASTQIERDLLRTLPTNRCFSKEEAPGVAALRRVLRALAFFYPELGYCQGMGTLVATLLLVCDEENSFWIMCKLIENFFPTAFYGDNLIGLRAEVKCLEHLIDVHMPEVGELLKESDTDVSLIMANWLLTMCASIFPLRLLFHVWDMVFQKGIAVLYRVLISMVKMNEERMLSQTDITERPSGVFSFLQELPQTITNISHLVELVTTFEFSITEHTVVTLRKTYQGNLMTETGLIHQADANLPKQQHQTRRLQRSKSFVKSIFNKSTEAEEDPKTKNVRVTELIVDLRNSIYQICDHFRNCPDKHAVSIQANYDPNDHRNDREDFLKARREGKKHARALLDFEAQEPDELSFRKNEIITILSEKDEHCWVGELAERRGWFPAKFVQIVDERGQHYCAWGDESITPRIGRLCRNQLAHSIQTILSYGLRPAGIVAYAATHPWHFIEALAHQLMEAHNNITHSRLTLCDTFNLDQDGKVLCAEELLFRSVHSITSTHTAPTIKDDTRFRSLIAFGLNEQCLHMWFEVFCAASGLDVLRQSYYHDWSFVRSPVWQQIKCELRLLSQFCFNLNVDFEVQQAAELERIRSAAANPSVPSVAATQSAAAAKSRRIGPAALALSDAVAAAGSASSSQPLKEGVRDMLIKHNLFSWDL